MLFGFLSQPVWLRLVFALLHFLWQGSLVGILILLLLHLFNLRRGMTRYAAYLFAFLIMAACPVVTFFVLTIGTPGVIEQEIAIKAAEKPTGSNDRPSDEAHVSGDSVPSSKRRVDYLYATMPWIVVGWLIGVCVLSIRLLFGFAGVYRWRRRLVPLPENLAQSIAALSERLGMPGFLRVFASPFARLPIAVGYFRPMVLLPLTMLTQLPAEMLDAIIAHELAHIRRFDLWVNVFQRAVETFLFYHPVVWWLSNRLRNEREFCCDELAAEATGSRSTYASALEYVGRASLAATKLVLVVDFSQPREAILARVRHVLGMSSPPKLARDWLAGILTLVAVVVLGIVGHTTAIELHTEAGRLGVGTSDGAATFHRVAVGEVSGKEAIHKTDVFSPSGEWTDLIKLVDSHKHTQNASWEVVGDVAHFGARKPRAYVTIPLVVEGSYELNVKVTITRAKETTRLVLPVNGKTAIFDIRGDRGNTESPTATIKLSGLSPTPTAKTSRTMNIGQEYDFLFKVTVVRDRATINVAKDGKVLYNWDGQLSGVTGDHFSTPGTIGLETAYYTTSQFRSLKLQMISPR
ncbi:MAG: M56 family metallopeptidase [Planctomycetota bacterium]|jgi:beta-lactamase regulating signal transducer with metallopeptidase domain